MCLFICSRGDWCICVNTFMFTDIQIGGRFRFIIVSVRQINRNYNTVTTRKVRTSMRHAHAHSLSLFHAAIDRWNFDINFKITTYTQIHSGPIKSMECLHLWVCCLQIFAIQMLAAHSIDKKKTIEELRAPWGNRLIVKATAPTIELATCCQVFIVCLYHPPLHN